MADVSEHFKETIENHLNERAKKDPLFAKSLEKEHKDIEGCINYILKQVKKIGAKGYKDEEIYNLAAHYYDEDDLEEADPISCDVVVNHKPELTEDEKEQYREKARQRILNEERQRLQSVGKPKTTEQKQEAEQSNLFSS